MYISREKQNMILDLLVEGMSIRAISRLTKVDTKTILRLLVKAGEKCHNLYNRMMTNLTCERIQADEIWTFVNTKDEHLKNPFEEKEWGDQYVFVALDADTKLVPTFYVGKRTPESTMRFIFDLKMRLNNKPQLTTDGYSPYLVAVDKAFGNDVHYAQVIKQYSGDNVTESKRRYAPADIIGVLLQNVKGHPMEKHISTSFVERQNLSMRMNMRRFTRLSNGFSKKAENLFYMLSIYYMHYNFIKIHGTIKTTPAVKARLVDKVWTWDNIFA